MLSVGPCFDEIDFDSGRSSDVQIGDVVTIGECRPLSKTVRFNVLKVAKGASSKKQFQKF